MNYQFKLFDLEEVRTQLRHGNLSLSRMGYLIPMYYPACKYHPIVPQTRLWEWEDGRRPVPDYVYYVYGTVLVEDWASDRHEVAPHVIPEVDVFYATLLSPGFGETLKAEHYVQQSTDPNLLALLPGLQSMRQGWSEHFKNVFGLDMDPIWAETLEDLFKT